MCNYSEYVYEKGIEKGIEKGYEKGYEKGIFSALYSLLSSHLLSIEDAAAHVNMTPAEFLEKLTAYNLPLQNAQ